MQGLTCVDQAILKLNSLTLACLYLKVWSLPSECWDFKLVLIVAGIETSPGHLQVCTEFLRGTEFRRGGREERILGGCPAEGIHLSEVLFTPWGVEPRALLLFMSDTGDSGDSTLSFFHFYILSLIRFQVRVLG